MGGIGWDLYKERLVLSGMGLDDVLKTFQEAGGTFADLLDRPEVQQCWEEPSTMVGYTVGGVVGHVNAAVGWLEPLLDTPPPLDLRPIRAGSYFVGMKVDPDGTDRHPLHDVIRDRSEHAAEHGWEANRQKFRSVVERLVTRLEGESGDRVLDLRPVVPAAIRLADFLRTRIVDVVVHTDDLAASVGIDTPDPSTDAATTAIEVMIALARRTHGDLEVLRALARRERANPAVFPVF